MFYATWAGTLIFHVTNAYLIGHIGQFPWMMLCASTVFLPPHWPAAVVAFVHYRAALVYRLFRRSSTTSDNATKRFNHKAFNDSMWGPQWRVPDPSVTIKWRELLVLIVVLLFATQQVFGRRTWCAGHNTFALTDVTIRYALHHASDRHTMPEAGSLRQCALES
jgi:hypothetical protein